MNLSVPNSNNVAQFSWFDTFQGFATSENMVDADKIDTICNPELRAEADVFDRLFINSYDYDLELSYVRRAGGGEYIFTYNDTYLGLAFHHLIDTDVTILVDGSIFSIDTITNNNLLVKTLPAGQKTVTIIEGLVSKLTLLNGSFLNRVVVRPETYVKLYEQSTVEKFVFLGDSITQGVSSGGNASTVNYAKLFKYDDSKEVTTLGWASGTLIQLASTTPLVDDTVDSITHGFINTTTTKKLIILIGTNDYAVSLAAATFKTYYENLVDAVNASDSSIEIFCISPLLRNGETSLLDDYRTAISDLCGVRAFCTYIEGKTILTLGDLSDGLHPSVSGHQKLHDSIDSIIL